MRRAGSTRAMRRQVLRAMLGGSPSRPFVHGARNSVVCNWPQSALRLPQGAEPPRVHRVAVSASPSTGRGAASGAPHRCQRFACKPLSPRERGWGEGRVLPQPMIDGSRTDAWRANRDPRPRPARNQEAASCVANQQPPRFQPPNPVAPRRNRGPGAAASLPHPAGYPPGGCCHNCLQFRLDRFFTCPVRCARSHACEVGHVSSGRRADGAGSVRGD
jgi:hypothetical protein